MQQSPGNGPSLRVLFICLGNICRSPMAEAVFAHLVREAGLEGHIEADSAGTGGWHAGEHPHSGTRRVLAASGITDYKHCARQLSRGDLDAFDYLVTMDDRNLRDVRRLLGDSPKVSRLMDYAPHLGVTEVPDPYYTGGFGGVYSLVREACEGLQRAIREEHGL